MKKRLRKKLHRGEYAVFGFHLEFTTRERLAWTLSETIVDGSDLNGPGIAFSNRLDEWAHGRGWCCAPGGDGKRWGCFAVPARENRPRPGITAEGRDVILSYVRALPEVEAVVAGPLVDSWVR